MSAQYGVCNFDGKPVDPEDLDEVRPVLAPYGPDGEGYICKDNFGVLYRAFHTTRESRSEIQPHAFASGAFLTWDGRLDNREDLIDLLERKPSVTSTDLEIVASAYERWGTDSFARLIGDWALSIWEAKDRCLILAKDFVGTRQLHYSVEKNRVVWCTILDPLVQFAGHSFKLRKEYVVSWLTFFPAPQLTPYLGIHSVPPSSFVRLKAGKRTIVKYWDFDPCKRVRYGTDAEYEQKFREVFSLSVCRRLRSNAPVLADLSGGMDSSSIVCIADEIIRTRGVLNAPRLDTLSYYDDDEPNCDDSAYFAVIEKKRGRPGCHIRLRTQHSLSLERQYDSFTAVPGIAESADAATQLAVRVTAQGNRATLSGFGGDEVLGGVPTPIPELTDLLARCRLRTLARQLKVWALSRRIPWFHLFFEGVREFLPPSVVSIGEDIRPAPWLHPDFAHRYRSSLMPDQSRAKILGPLPSFQAQLKTFDVLRRQLGCSALEQSIMCEKRHPYLDRDLLEFLFAIPRQQLVRPGQRRSLMRRALVGIVPDEILHRRRKAFVVRGPITYIANRWPEVLQFSQGTVLGSLKILDEGLFLNALKRAKLGQQIAIVPLLRTFVMEQWLRNPNVRKYLDLDAPALLSGAFHSQTREPGRTVPGN